MAKNATLEEMRKYVEKATPGPWEWMGENWAAVNAPHRNTLGVTSFTICTAVIDLSDEDGEFCARARTDMPRLLAVAKAAAKVNIAHYEFCSCPKPCDCEARVAALEELWLALAALNGESPSPRPQSSTGRGQNPG